PASWARRRVRHDPHRGAHVSRHGRIRFPAWISDEEHRAPVGEFNVRVDDGRADAGSSGGVHASTRAGDDAAQSRLQCRGVAGAAGVRRKRGCDDGRAHGIG
ncbi:hypothetical protein COI72_29935, partial [Bacillus cereus]